MNWLLLITWKSGPLYSSNCTDCTPHTQPELATMPFIIVWMTPMLLEQKKFCYFTLLIADPGSLIGEQLQAIQLPYFYLISNLGEFKRIAMHIREQIPSCSNCNLAQITLIFSCPKKSFLCWMQCMTCSCRYPRLLWS